MPERHGRVELRARLERRRGEIEHAALARINAIADPPDSADPAYVEGLRTSVMAAIDFGLAAVEEGSPPGPPVPVSLLAQSRLAARSGVSLDVVMRRYCAGFSLLGYFLIEEANRDGLIGGEELQGLVGSQAAIFDRLLAAIGEEHAREMELRSVPAKRTMIELIDRLLRGELIDTSDLPYEFDGWHLGVIAVGPAAAESLRRQATVLGLRLLLVNRHGEVVWAWLGSTRSSVRLSSGIAELRKLEGWAQLAIGEPGARLAGWRLTHRQAAAALTVAKRGSERTVRYSEVALAAAALKDELLAISLHQIYVEPFAKERDRGAALRSTLRAYLNAGGNLSSSAAALGVSPRTVRNRLRKMEEHIDRPIHTALADIQTALELEKLSADPFTSRIMPSAVR